jgi:hypothetical protein
LEEEVEEKEEEEVEDEFAGGLGEVNLSETSSSVKGL